MAMVTLEPVLSSADQEAKVERAIWHSTVRNGEVQTDEAILKTLIERHFKYTGSTRARNLLDDWANSRGKFVKVFPTEYKRALGELSAAKQAKEKIAA
jgi:glutamate synthase (NADPH/NADH) large chain